MPNTLKIRQKIAISFGKKFVTI